VYNCVVEYCESSYFPPLIFFTRVYIWNYCRANANENGHITKVHNEQPGIPVYLGHKWGEDNTFWVKERKERQIRIASQAVRKIGQFNWISKRPHMNKPIVECGKSNIGDHNGFRCKGLGGHKLDLNFLTA